MTSNHSGTKYPKCDKSNFELAENYPTGSGWKMMYIGFSSCKILLQTLYMDSVSIQVANLRHDKKIMLGLEYIYDINGNKPLP